MFLIRLLKQECECFGADQNPFNRIKQFIQNEHPELSAILKEKGEMFFLNEEMQLQYPELHQIAIEFYHDACKRDSFMSENIMSLLGNLPETDRMMVWAHNGHIALNDCDGIPAMGSYLRDKLGQSYYALGFVTSSGTFQALDSVHYQLRVFSMPPQPENSWAHLCSKFGEDQFILDFRSAPPTDWMSSSIPLLTIGTTFSDSVPSFFFDNQIPLNHFDGLIYIRKTSAAHPMSTTHH
jgi:erythromycin esterase-like protein